MKFGLLPPYRTGAVAEPEWITRFAQHAEACGFESVYTRTDLPAGAGRLYGEADGVEHVLVNGVEIAAAGNFTGDRPGTLLRSGRDTDTVEVPGDAGRG